MSLFPYRHVDGISQCYEFDEVLDFLGSGQFASVFMAKSITESNGPDAPVGLQVALKVLKLADLERGKSYQDITNEVDILRRTKHPNCIRLLDVFQTPREVVLVLELIQGRELLETIKNTIFTEERTKNITRQILHALNYLHATLLVVHRDLKPENILITPKEDGTDHVTIIDFGLARAVGRRKPKWVQRQSQPRGLGGMSLSLIPRAIPSTASVDSLDSPGSHCNSPLFTTPCGTLRYAAPETIRSINNGGKLETTRALVLRVDMYAVGIMVYAMLCGAAPFSKCESRPLAQEMEKGPSFVGRRWDTVSADAKDFVKALFQTDPSKRPTAAVALEHRWIRQGGADANEDESTTTPILYRASSSSTNSQSFTVERTAPAEIACGNIASVRAGNTVPQPPLRPFVPPAPVATANENEAEPPLFSPPILDLNSPLIPGSAGMASVDDADESSDITLQRNSISRMVDSLRASENQYSEMPMADPSLAHPMARALNRPSAQRPLVTAAAGGVGPGHGINPTPMTYFRVESP